MLKGTISASQRRLLVLAATFFFVGSVYYCSSRLVAASFERQAMPSTDTKTTTTTTSPSHSDSDSSSSSTEPETHSSKSYKDIKLGHADLPMGYDLSGRPPLDDVITLRALPSDLVPSVSNGRRLVIVGDIHGMDAELSSLLHKVGFTPERDHLVATGDVVGEGPSPAAVVDRLAELNATAVRGAWEDRLLLTRREDDSRFGVSADLEAQTSLAPDHRGQADYVALARQLSDDNLEWLGRLPVILTVDQLQLAVVHAGLVPGIDLDVQDPAAIINMRSLTYPRVTQRAKAGEEPRILPRDAEGESESEPKPESAGTTSTEPASTSAAALAPAEDEKERQTDEPDDDEPTLESPLEMAADDDDDLDTSEITFDRQVVIPTDSTHGDRWDDTWAAYQRRLPRPDRRHVVFGSDSKAGYVETAYTVGLDSACYKGGALSALVIEPDVTGRRPFKQTVVQVECNQA